MDIVYYECMETGKISVISDYPAPLSLFCTEKIYKKLYKEELPRFLKNPHDIYALPLHESPLKIYNGIGRMGIDEISDIPESICFSEQELYEYMEISENHDDYEIIFTRISGSDEKIPEQYDFIGYDVSYPPESNGGFSIICDCMFICKWHGCDIEGTEFKKEFASLNENGLFDSFDSAYEYMAHYLSQEWSERGIFGIYEIYLKNRKKNT